jgi:hypothetical protein
MHYNPVVSSDYLLTRPAVVQTPLNDADALGMLYPQCLAKYLYYTRVVVNAQQLGAFLFTNNIISTSVNILSQL